ncbi:MFS transporter [Aerococcus sp. Group 2]|uniref:MFS transporter n=1 Tax=Aerococcus sp. Group 2 TaxID=2976811 RepID=UPI0018A7C4EE|nr:MFS transporter [Aerococcus sp. Group 2]MCY3036257.1 MFS transporter [Aerococcus sp. Group 2]
MRNNRYLPTALGLYINYIIHGMGVIIISQNQNMLMEQWGTDLAGIGSVIGWLGIGRLIAIVISGPLSDRFGRKPFVYLGMATYMAYFLGLIYSHSVAMASVFALIAGLSNSFLDSGTYPALMESFPENAGTANVLIKAFVQIGQFLLPLIIGFLTNNSLWFGWSFIIAVAVLGINMLTMWRMPFPDEDAKEQAEETGGDDFVSAVKFKSKPKWYIEGIAFVVYGFISQATFYLISQSLNTYGQLAAGLSMNEANALMSYYSVGSLLCVFVTAVIATRIRSVKLVMGYTFMSLVAAVLMWLYPTPTILKVGAALIGFFAAGGVMQLGLTVMGEMFPQGKGTVTSIFYTFGSVASWLIPNITPWLIENYDISAVMLFEVIIAAIGFVIGVIIFIRYYQVVDTSEVPE